MQDFPHHYRVTIDTRSSETTVTVTATGVPPLVTAPPAEFGGSGKEWSPETLLVAAVADCFVLGFKSIAAASKLEWSVLEVQVEGKLDRIERRMLFTEIAIVATVVVPEAARGRAPRILEKAEENCLITNSLSAKIQFTGNVKTGS